MCSLTPIFLTEKSAKFGSSLPYDKIIYTYFWDVVLFHSRCVTTFSRGEKTNRLNFVIIIFQISNVFL